MSLRDREIFLFFLEILCFFVPYYTRQVLQKIDAKRNDHVFPKLNEPSWILPDFCVRKQYFSYFLFCFPIDTSMKLLITWFSKFLHLFPDWYIHEKHFACNEELRHRGVKKNFTYHLIQGQKCLKCFYEIRILSKVARKIALFFERHDFSEMWYLIESDF